MTMAKLSLVVSINPDEIAEGGTFITPPDVIGNGSTTSYDKETRENSNEN